MMLVHVTNQLLRQVKEAVGGIPTGQLRIHPSLVPGLENRAREAGVAQGPVQVFYALGIPVLADRNLKHKAVFIDFEGRKMILGEAVTGQPHASLSKAPEMPPTLEASQPVARPKKSRSAGSKRRGHATKRSKKQ